MRYLASGRFITAGTIPCLFCQRYTLHCFIVLHSHLYCAKLNFSFNSAETIPSLFCFFARVHYDSLCVLSALHSALFYCAALLNIIFHNIVYIKFRSTFSQRKFPVFFFSALLCFVLFCYICIKIVHCTSLHFVHWSLCIICIGLYIVCVRALCALVYAFCVLFCAMQLPLVLCLSARICRP